MLIPTGSTINQSANTILIGTTVIASQITAAFTTDGKTLIAHVSATSVTGTAPTYDIKFQDTGDGINFVDIPTGAFAQLTAASAQRLVVQNVGAVCRAVITVGGTTPSAAVTLVAVTRI